MVFSIPNFLEYPNPSISGRIESTVELLVIEHSNLPGKVLVFCIGGRSWEVVAYKRWSHMQVRLHLGNAHQKQRSVITDPGDRLLQIRLGMLLQIRVIERPNFLQNIFPCCWNDLLPFVSPLFQFSTVFSVSSFCLRVNIVVLYQFTVFWSKIHARSKGSRLCFRFVDDDSGRKEWICESRY